MNTKISISIIYGESLELHAWLDEHHPGWIYCGSQFYVDSARVHSMTFQQRHDLYREQRERWAKTFPRQPVTQHFYIPDLDDEQLVVMKLCWNVTEFEKIEKE